MQPRVLPKDVRDWLWSDLGEIATAHVVMLRDVGIIDDAVLAALLTALDGVRRGSPPEGIDTIVRLVAAFDERVDALTPAGATGTITVARGRADTAATLARLALRREALALTRAVVGLRETLIALAGQHAATTMPAYVSGQPGQPTTFGHFLGGTIAPLGRASARLHTGVEAANVSPLGAVALASTSLPIERERTAALLGFAGPADNTFDAVAAVDYLVTLGEAAAAAVAPVRRLLGEVGTWLRTEPDSFRLSDRWLSQDPGLPQMVVPTAVHRLAALAADVEATARVTTQLAAGVGYEPVGARLDGVLAACLGALLAAKDVTQDATALFREGIEVNRAYLANRAGRGHTTSSDLAIFLMEAEGLDPAAAANIAAMTVNRAMADGIEASGITTQMIDASALLVIGRELAVEFEAISRYLAPRRFLERRSATGSPAPAATREYLGREAQQLRADAEWLTAVDARLAAAVAERERLVHETLTTRD